MPNKTIKIVSWNTCGKFREKFHLLTAFNADVFVIPECEDPSSCSLSQYHRFATSGIWIGENKNKGLGIFHNSKSSIYPLKWENFGLKTFCQ